jgi:hypothetical protein
MGVRFLSFAILYLIGETASVLAFCAYQTLLAYTRMVGFLFFIHRSNLQKTLGNVFVVFCFILILKRSNFLLYIMHIIDQGQIEDG